MRSSNEMQELVRGALSIIGINIVVLIVMLLWATYQMSVEGGEALFVYFFSVFGLSLLQWVYVIPVLIVLGLRRKWLSMSGVLVGAAITGIVGFGSCFVPFLFMPGFFY